MMEGIQKAFQNISEAVKFEAPRSLHTRMSPNTVSAMNPEVLVTRPPRQMVSLWTCSKLCAIFFTAGVVVGYTLKRSVRRWAAKLLKRLKDE